MNPKVDRLIRTAITERRLLRLDYNDLERIVEPHDYGELKGIVQLLTWQRGGSSSGPLPNWRWMQVEKISDAELLTDTFPGGRSSRSRKHQNWDKLYARVKPADTES